MDSSNVACSLCWVTMGTILLWHVAPRKVRGKRVLTGFFTRGHCSDASLYWQDWVTVQFYLKVCWKQQCFWWWVYESCLVYVCVCPCFSLILIRISEYHLDRNLRVWEKLLATQLLGSVQWSKWKDTGMLISGSWHIQQQQSKQFASVKRRSEHCGNFGLAFIRASVTWLQINANLVSVCWMCKYRTRLIVEFWGWYSYAYFGVERIWFACICQVFIFYIYLNNMNK